MMRTRYVVAAMLVLGLLSTVLSACDDGNASLPRRDPPARSAPVETGPRLTGGEAAAKVEAEFRRARLRVTATGISFACDAEDYNRITRDWIVLCVLTGPGPGREHYRVRVDDATGLVSVIE